MSVVRRDAMMVAHRSWIGLIACLCCASHCRLRSGRLAIRRSMSSHHTRTHVTEAPNAIPAPQRGNQLTQPKLLKEALGGRSSAWRSEYEWRRESERDLPQTQHESAKPHYAWMNTPTARRLIEATAAHELKRAKLFAGQGDEFSNPTEEKQQASSQSQSQQQFRPANPLARDSLDEFSAASQQQQQPQQPFHSPSPFGEAAPSSHAADAAQQFSPRGGSQTQRGGGGSNATRQMHLAGCPISPRSTRGLPLPLSSRAGASGPLSSRGGPVELDRTARGSANSKAGYSSNFHLRGAGALPTHAATTRRALHRLSAGHAAGVTPACEIDWSEWARSMEKKLAQSKGTLATGRGKPAHAGIGAGAAANSNSNGFTR